MENSFRYYKNTACQYYPCHNTDVDEFNCMFCYCPLYLIKECGGRYSVISGIKDCSRCFIPHSFKGYDYINERLIQYTKANPLED